MKADVFYKYLKNPGLMDHESLIALRELVWEHPAFQTAWMLYLKNLMLFNDPMFQDELKNASIFIQDRRKLYLFLYQQSEKEYLEIFDGKAPVPEHEDLLEIDYTSAIAYELEGLEHNNQEILSNLAASIRKKSKKKKDLLVDRFTKNEPLIELDEVHPGISATTAEGQKEEFVSETLANIYARQGYHEKAIEVFEKLSLKYPEKSIYFAAQIEEIKKLKNN